MSRFDASTEADRIDLVAATVAAHRERGSQFCTLEADEDPSDDPDFLPPWVQYADGTLNLDCTDEELDALAEVLDEFGGFAITERTTDEEAPGTNVRIQVRGDDERVGQFVERVFRDVYRQPADFRLWAVEV